MRVVLQRVSRATVMVDSTVVGEIDRGFLLLVGIEDSDGEPETVVVAEKIAGLRVFADEDGRMNLSLSDVDGQALVVSQFTLYGDIRKGRRPSFTRAGDPAHAASMIDRFVEALNDRGVPTATGRFGARMEVALVNDGPVTLFIEAREGKIL